MALVDPFKRIQKRIRISFGKREFYHRDEQGRLVCEEYYKNGQLRARQTFKDGNRNGPYEKYCENGQLREKCSYKNDVEDGLYEFYYDNGQLGARTIYKSGKKEGLSESYYDNGQLKEKCTFVDGEKNGLCEWYHKNGQLYTKCTYKNGVQEDGICKEYHPNGQLWVECSYQNGELEGELKRYDESGNLEATLIFHKGEELSGPKAEAYRKHQAAIAEQQKEEESSKAIMRKLLEEEMARRGKSKGITDNPDTEKVDTTTASPEATDMVNKLMEQLVSAADLSQKPVGQARTIERQKKAEELVIARRRSDILNRITRQILSGGDKELEEKMAQTTDKAKLSVLYREAYAKLSDDDKKLCAKIGRETGAIMTKAKDTLEKERRSLRIRRKSGQR